MDSLNVAASRSITLADSLHSIEFIENSSIDTFSTSIEMVNKYGCTFLEHPAFSGFFGALLGALMAVLISMYVLSREIRQRKEEVAEHNLSREKSKRDDYSNSLFLILVILANHLRMSQLLHKELGAIINYSIKKGKLASDGVEMRFRTNELQRLIDRISKYWNVDSDILASLVNYAFTTNYTNEMLDFKSARALCENPKNTADLKIALDSSLGTMRREIKRLDSGREHIYSIVKSELSEFNPDKVNVEDYKTIEGFLVQMDERNGYSSAVDK